MKDLVQAILNRKYTDAEVLVKESMLTLATDKIEERKVTVAQSFFESVKANTLDEEELEEDVEALDEVSKGLTKRYINKVNPDMRSLLNKADSGDGDTEKLDKKFTNRSKGLERALDKRDGNGKAKVPAKD